MNGQIAMENQRLDSQNWMALKHDIKGVFAVLGARRRPKLQIDRKTRRISRREIAASPQKTLYIVHRFTISIDPLWGSLEWKPYDPPVVATLQPGATNSEVLRTSFEGNIYNLYN